MTQKFLFQDFGTGSDLAMVRGLEAFSRRLTGIRIGWSGLALILSFTAAVAISGKGVIYEAI